MRQICVHTYDQSYTCTKYKKTDLNLKKLRSSHLSIYTYDSLIIYYTIIIIIILWSYWTTFSLLSCS